MKSEADTPMTKNCPMCGATTALRVSHCLSCGENLTGIEGPEEERSTGPLLGEGPRLAAVSTDGTIFPRIIAATLDNVIAGVIGFGAATSISEELPVVQVPLFLGTYLGYYLLFEGGLSRTPGKMLSGLTVVQFNASRITWRQALIRTLFRSLEVNPACLGALPAGISILWSPNRQRWGDRLAGTVVVLSRHLRRKR